MMTLTEEGQLLQVEKHSPSQMLIIEGGVQVVAQREFVRFRGGPYDGWHRWSDYTSFIEPNLPPWDRVAIYRAWKSVLRVAEAEGSPTSSTGTPTDQDGSPRQELPARPVIGDSPVRSAEMDVAYISPRLLLRELVRRHPRAITILYRHGIPPTAAHLSIERAAVGCGCDVALLLSELRSNLSPDAGVLGALEG